MTNFQPEQKATGLALVTPERALLLLPVLAGVVVAAVIAGLALVPLAGKLKELDKLEKARIIKLNALAKKVSTQGSLFQQQARSKAQKMKLLQLVAGDRAGERSLATLLSQLSVEAAKAGVNLESYEPQTSTAAPVAATPAASGDPLLGEGVKKEQKLMVVKGSYQGLLMFLRQLEWVTPLLVISDLSLEAGQEKAETTLKFTLTAYSRTQPLVKP